MPLHNQFNRNARQTQAADALLKKLDVGTLPSRKDLSFVMSRAGELAPQPQVINWQSNQNSYQLEVVCRGSDMPTWKLLTIEADGPAVKWTVMSEDPEYIYRLILKKSTPTATVEDDIQTNRSSADIVKGALFLNRYRIIEPIARGGMGQIFQATDISMNRAVALKVLHSHLLDDEPTKIRFEREMQACLDLTHPNIVSVSDYGYTAYGIPYMVMEYIDGPTLDELLHIEGPLNIQDFTQVFLQICSALQQAHDKQIIHRDIKPSNIMLIKQADHGFVAKIVDFGIAKTVGNTSGVTKTGEVIGTLFYMSPEQCQNEPLDQRSDIYSLGIVMYETLCGAKPFMAETPLATMMLQLYQAPAAFSEIGCEVPKTLESIIFKALNKDPQNRYQSLKELWDALTEFKQNHTAHFNLSEFVSQSGMLHDRDLVDEEQCSLSPVLQLLVAAQVVDLSEAQAATMLKTMHGGKELFYLIELGTVDEQTYQLAVDCHQFMQDFKLTLEQTALTLKYCKNTGNSLEQALAEMS